MILQIQTKPDILVLVDLENFKTGILAVNVNNVAVDLDSTKVEVSYYKLTENENGQPGEVKYIKSPISISSAKSGSQNTEIVYLTAVESGVTIKSIGIDILAAGESFNLPIMSIASKAAIGRLLQKQKFRKIDSDGVAQLLEATDFEVVTEIEVIPQP